MVNSGIKYIIKKHQELIPKWIIDLGYLSNEVQLFHDTDLYWESTGLSESGKQLIRSMIAYNNLDESKFVKYL